MALTKGPGAARARMLLTGRTWDAGEATHTSVYLPAGILRKAEQYKLCSPYGRGGMLPVSEYLYQKLVADIREKEREEKERTKKLNPLYQGRDENVENPG